VRVHYREEALGDSTATRFAMCFYECMLKGWTVLKSFNTAQNLMDAKRIFLLLPEGDHNAINLPERGHGPNVTVTSKKKPLSNLKRPTCCFVGRMTEVCEVYRFLSDAKKRILVITSGSKIGKLEVHAHIYSNTQIDIVVSLV
jgi:hypothetical protein